MIEPGVKDDGVSATSVSLLERAKANDRDAWQSMCDLYLPLIHTWCRRAGIHSANLADLGQEVLLAAARNLPSFQRHAVGGTFRGWLHAIAKNKIVDFFRSQGPVLAPIGGSSAQQCFAQVAFDADSADSDVDVDADKAMLCNRAIELISCEFPDWYKTAFLQLVIDQRPAQEIASELGKRVSAIHNVKARVLKRLREQFAELLD
ncbi:MAG TPA: RNA polymerase sigma factor [Pirellulales bacterium]|nr:RNA polymerase sigma factor [Pirellulales bacterium]